MDFTEQKNLRQNKKKEENVAWFPYQCTLNLPQFAINDACQYFWRTHDVG